MLTDPLTNSHRESDLQDDDGSISDVERISQQFGSNLHLIYHDRTQSSKAATRAALELSSLPLPEYETLLLPGNLRFVGAPLPFIKPDLLFQCAQVSRIEKFFSQITASSKMFFLHNTCHGQNAPPPSLPKLLELAQIMRKECL